MLSRLIAVASCHACSITFYLQRKTVPPLILAFFGGFPPSQGHRLWLCKILRAEWQHKVRIFRACLHFQLHCEAEPWSAWNLWLQYSKIVYRYTEFYWQLILPHHWTSLPTKRPATKNSVHVLRDVRLPGNVADVLSLGPKFAVAPRKSKPELLSLVRHTCCEHHPGL